MMKKHFTAIIAILASMLLPSLSRARETARMASCTNNLKTLGMWHAFYVDDYDGFLPMANTSAVGGWKGGMRWPQLLSKLYSKGDLLSNLTKVKTTSNPFNCPSVIPTAQQLQAEKGYKDLVINTYLRLWALQWAQYTPLPVADQYMQNGNTFVKTTRITHPSVGTLPHRSLQTVLIRRVITTPTVTLPQSGCCGICRRRVFTMKRDSHVPSSGIGEMVFQPRCCLWTDMPQHKTA